VLAPNQAKVEKRYFLSSLFIGLKSNQKRLLNFYKELAIASLCAHVTADELSLRAMALTLGLRLREPHLRSLRSIALCKSLITGNQYNFWVLNF